MASNPDRKHIRYRAASPPGTGRYEVLYKGTVIGTVGRFRLSAGQFGSGWMATTLGRRRSGKYMTREAAATWLVEQARVSDRP